MLSCLYDIGSTNLIDKKIPLSLLKPPLRSIAQCSRPVFRFLAVRWFHQNCPKLITDWLQTLVLFEPIESELPAAIDVRNTPVGDDRNLALAVQQKHNEVVQLQQQLRQTTVLAVTNRRTLW